MRKNIILSVFILMFISISVIVVSGDLNNNYDLTETRYIILKETSNLLINANDALIYKDLVYPINRAFEKHNTFDEINGMTCPVVNRFHVILFTDKKILNKYIKNNYLEYPYVIEVKNVRKVVQRPVYKTRVDSVLDHFEYEIKGWQKTMLEYDGLINHDLYPDTWIIGNDTLRVRKDSVDVLNETRFK